MRSVENMSGLTVESEVAEELRKIQAFDCNCQKRRKENSERPALSCSKKLSAELIYQNRLDTASLTPKERDMCLLSIIGTCQNVSEMTQNTKKVNGVRVASRTAYRFHDVVVCRPTFCFIYGISDGLLKILFKHYKTDGLTPRERKKQPRTHKRQLRCQQSWHGDGEITP